MKVFFLVASLVGALVAELRTEWQPWLTEVKLKKDLSESTNVLSEYFAGAGNESWLDFVNRLTPRSQVQLTLLGNDIRLDGQAEIAKAIRSHQQLLKGLHLEATNAVVEAEAGHLATVLVQAVVSNSDIGLAEPVMLRLSLIRVSDQWLIHHVRTVEGYMSLV